LLIIVPHLGRFVRTRKYTARRLGMTK
jgi:hypothetical protein